MKVDENPMFFAELVLELGNRIIEATEDLVSKENMKNIHYQAVIPAAVILALSNLDKRNKTRSYEACHVLFELDKQKKL